MLFYTSTGEKKNWLIQENKFDAEHLGRIESLFHLANGYMGVRASAEERYLNEQRGMFVSGTFNKFAESEVPELPNVPDLLNVSMVFDGERMAMSENNCSEFLLALDMQTATLTRSFVYRSRGGANISLKFIRIVSMARKHILAQKIVIRADRDAELSVKSGINGTVTNTGVQHFICLQKRIYHDEIMQACFRTTQSKINFCLNTGHRWFNGNTAFRPEQRLEIAGRGISMNYKLSLKADCTYIMEKTSGVYTSRDKEWSGRDFDLLKAMTADSLLGDMDNGFDALLKESAAVWNEIWKKHDILIDSDNDFNQVSIRYAIFQIIMMTPAHDNRMNIGAKGLSGEAYKGHTFWDTEIFLLPFWVLTDPDVAKSLLEYRYLSLGGARKKAAENGYEGAMYPWESAWTSEGEATPKWGNADVVTGQPLPIICGDLEQHITCDVAYGVWYYYQMTKDEDFMNRSGYEIIFETAAFWQSRWEWDEKNRRYVIDNVIGPDEYSEHVNNNAYTNYMSCFNVKLAIEYYEKIRKEKPELFAELDGRLSLGRYYKLWKEKVGLIYLPQPNSDKLIPQDDTYLTLPAIPLEKYKNSPARAEIIKDYNMEQISRLQVSKQADVLVLLYLMGRLFPLEVKKANYDFYESRCLHDSSLSLSIHSIIASSLGKDKPAMDLFKRAQAIDLNDSPASAAEGIHAASMGGIWQCVVNGFAGVRMDEDCLRVEPRLPEGWRSMRFILRWRGIELKITAEKGKITVLPDKFNKELKVCCCGKSCPLDREVVVTHKTDSQAGDWRQ